MEDPIPGKGRDEWGFSLEDFGVVSRAGVVPAQLSKNTNSVRLLRVGGPTGALSFKTASNIRCFVHI
jgi:hypothetical protein